MKLSDWAKKNGLTYQTAFNLFKSGKLPCKSRQLATGTILVDEEPIVKSEDLKTYIYCRVSSRKQKKDLDNQVERCITFCNAKGYDVEKVIKEIASGMNDNRRELIKIINNNPKRIVVEHKDRLTRFGFNYLEHTLTLLGYEIIVINRDQEDETDLVKDLVSIVTSFCCRLYGLRRGRTKTVKIKEVLNGKEN